MRLSLHLGASKLALLFLALLCLAAALPPHPPNAPLPPADGAPLDEDWLARWPRGPRAPPLRPGVGVEVEEEEEEEEEEEALPRARRGDLAGRPLSPFPTGLSVEGGDGEEGGWRNEALTSIAEGLQAISRERGGFGFRFGRKRWSDRGWMDGGGGVRGPHLHI
ncbi:uncharacterized protein qrfp [Pseudoliparis swirei]|uniref:uncharacterized protein qrfp n=1 Tax=Pseudoliparis swirei TaxID=2059687 RepID=UPI0024BEE044|nr:uncharacterized protein qrfp [Pseudoliparis swirei]